MKAQRYTITQRSTIGEICFIEHSHQRGYDKKVSNLAFKLKKYMSRVL